MSTLDDRVAGGLYGLLIGDAVGVPYEFHDAANLPPREAIDYHPPLGFRRAHPQVPPGTWSDDGAQALNLLASLLDSGRFDPDDFGRRLVAWLDQGELAVDSDVFDVGITTHRAIERLKQGTPALQAGPSSERDNGNGSLMRVLPLALWHRGTDEELVHDARRQSSVTHGHLRSQICCALYCLWARRVLDHSDPGEAWIQAATTLRTLESSNRSFLTELDKFIQPDQPPSGTGSGYVVDCLNSARWAIQAGEGDFEAVVKAAISLGDDTDTTACVAGGIIGLVVGHSGIPERWRSGLRGRELADPLLERLIAHRSVEDGKYRTS